MRFCQCGEFPNVGIFQSINITTMVTNAPQATQSSNHSHGNNNLGSRQGKPILGKPWEPQLSTGKDGTTDPEKTCHYCKDTGHDLDNCLHLQCKKHFLAQKQSRKD